jgi:two-component system response regulator (stage 0 sporulation protein F)
LIIEDTDDIARIIELTLDHLGVESKHANNGSKALQLVSESLPDLILLDIGLPGMSGWEVLEAIKNRYPDAEFPVIVMTAFGDPANRLIGKFQKHVSHYFVKPFEVKDLTQAIREALKL